MGIGYELVNQSKSEVITFARLPTSKARELTGNPVSAAITTWYLVQNRGDRIAFVSDTEGDWPFPQGSIADLAGYRDVTDDMIDQLIEAKILRDNGFQWSDSEDPSIWIRAIENVWMHS